MRKRLVKFSTMFILSSILFIGCAKVIQNVADNVKYELIGMDVKLEQNVANVFDAFFNGNLEALSKINIIAYIKLINKNDINLFINRTSYEIFYDSVKIAQGSIDSDIELKSNETKTISIPVNIGIDTLVKNNIKIDSNEDKDKIIIVGKNYIHTTIGDFIIHFSIINNKVQIDSIKYD